MPRKLIPTPVKCGAHARSTGLPCEHYARPGSRRCWMHGGVSSPDGRAAAEARVDSAALVATFLERDPRPVEVVLSDALHGADSMMSAGLARVREGENLTISDLERLSESIRFATNVASSATTARLAERRVVLEEQTAAEFVKVLRAVLDADELGLTLAQRRTGETVAARVLTTGRDAAAHPSRSAVVEPVPDDVVEGEIVGDVEPVPDDVVEPVREPVDAQLPEPVAVPEQVVRMPSQVDAASDTTQPAERRDRLGRRRISGEDVVRERAGGWPL